MVVVHELLGNCACRERSYVLHGSRIRSGCRNNYRIVGSAVLIQKVLGRYDGAHLLTDGNLDADDVLAGLIDDCIESDGGLTCLTVADDKLTLASSDRCKSVDRCNTSHKGLIDR